MRRRSSADCLSDKIDVAAFEAAVKDKTGFDVRLQEELLGGTVEADFEPDVLDVMRGIAVDDTGETASAL